MHQKITDFILKNPQLPTPYNILDIGGAMQTYHEFKKNMKDFNIFYAVKCNSETKLLEQLVRAGSSFDCASIEEIELVIKCGAKPENISFGNTVKKAANIRAAHQLGVKLFAADSELEIQKIATNAPGADVFVRIIYEGLKSAWPLSRKFGCSMNMAIDLVKMAKDLGLNPRGISFHVGSQMHTHQAWHHPISVAHKIFTECAKMGIEMDLLNCGGGFPGEYRDKTPNLAEYSDGIKQHISEFFGNKKLFIIIEPGRGIAANNAAVVAEVVLISKKYKSDSMRWVYIDAGIYNGLFDALGEGIKYEISTINHTTNQIHNQKNSDLAVIAGPTCDSVDILYEKNPYSLPNELQIGDKFVFHNAGAYSRNVSSCGFNGFHPLSVIVLD